jgi:hypothetical protein
VGQSKLFNIEDEIFTEQRLRLYGSGLLVAYGLALIWALFQGRFLIDQNGMPACIDFSWMWASGKFAASSAPVDAYDYSIFSALRVALVGPVSCILDHFDYPPILMFLTYPLSFMPYLAAYAVWITITFLLYGSCIYSIVPRPTAVIVAATPCVVLVNIQYGHNGFLTAGLIGLGLTLMERRSGISGIVLGLLSYKPQFGLLLPGALLASRNWRVFFCAIAAVAALALTASAFFGYETWPSFFSTLIHRDANLMLDDRLVMTFQSPFGLLRWTGAHASVGWVGHVAAAVVVFLSVCAIWTKPAPHAVKAAALCIGSVMVTPYVLPWDLCILAVAAAFLVKDGLQHGFLPGERLVMFACWLGLFLLLARTGPVAPVVDAILLLVVWRRVAARERGQFPLFTATVGCDEAGKPTNGGATAGVSAWAARRIG